ncbi:MAG: cytochrome c biogenesis protein CcdA [Gemmatimonadetes bacterium]|jgi:cytochrome c-type biogenesis protein|nr:cytochrome c biogenesis protein CcdA [Gemmatimonadota bacterium]
MNGDAGTVSLGVAFAAGVVSFLSPCVLPIVPSYVSFVTGLTLEELQEGDGRAARRQAAVHSALFILGFSGLFVVLGATATAMGGVLVHYLPVLQQVGGVVVILFGVYMLGLLRIPSLMEERRVHLASKPAGKIGSVVAGAAFGAGWTPCIGPVLATILLYAGLEATVVRGTLLLAVYALGLGLPFFVAAVTLNWFLSSTRGLRRWLGALERATGGFLVLVGILMITGRFAALSRFFAGFGQLVHLEGS